MNYKEISNWIFHYDYKIQKWVAFSAKNSVLCLDENFDNLQSEDIDDLMTDILEIRKNPEKKYGR